MRAPLMLTVLDEIVLSVFSLALNFALIRLWPPALFGTFVFIIALGLLFYSLESSLFTTQLAVLRPSARAAGQEQNLLVTLWTANGMLTGVLAITTAVGTALFAPGPPLQLPLAAALFVISVLTREYIRSLLFSEFRPGIALATDLGYVALAVPALTLLIGRGNVQINGVLLCLAGANIAAVLPIIVSRSSFFCVRWDADSRARYAAIWRDQARWAVVGAVMHEVMDRAHVFVVASFFGAAAAGILQAGEVLFRPLRLLLQAWERLAKPLFARLAAACDIASARLITLASLAAFLAGAAVFFLALWTAWPLIADRLYGHKYSGIGSIAILWSIAAVARIASQVLNTELQGFARFSELSAVSAVSSLIALLLLLVTVIIGDYALTILAIAAGHLVAFLLMTAIIARFYRAARMGDISRSSFAYLPPWLSIGRAPPAVALKSAQG